MRRLLTVAASLSLVVGLAACGGDDGPDPTGGVAFVVGARSNMPAPHLDGRALEALDTAVEDQSLVSIVVADGEPSLLGTMQLVAEGANGHAQGASRAENRRFVVDGLTSARADDEETDLLAAIDMALRSISSASGQHTVVVIDSGLSTAGALDLREPGLLDADPDAMAADLKTAGHLPDLEGVTVVLQGIGDTFAPQAPLDRPQRTQLADVWTAIVRAAGADDVVVEESPLTQPPVGVLPVVTPVEVADARTCTVTLTSNDVRFAADSAEFLDRDAAVGVLAPLARQLGTPGVSAVLTGTTADVGDMGGQVALSQSRAEAVRSLLAELGAQQDAMAAVGLGSDFPEYVEDRDANGDLVEEHAAQNRKVVVQLVGGAGLTCG
ncbi:OmpA family protein [Geodermatophilus saharensis]|uniref:OmpA family protein n=1 Tax=Geodermatophilus saharensis TaxID=1137994 RepID=UPI000B7993D8|nr:OmpA family protein [Geodermatophilus saharensis]